MPGTWSPPRHAPVVSKFTVCSRDAWAPNSPRPHHLGEGAPLPSKEMRPSGQSPRAGTLRSPSWRASFPSGRAGSLASPLDTPLVPRVPRQVSPQESSARRHPHTSDLSFLIYEVGVLMLPQTAWDALVSQGGKHLPGSWLKVWVPSGPHPSPASPCRGQNPEEGSLQAPSLKWTRALSNLTWPPKPLSGREPVQREGQGLQGPL